MKQLYFVTSNKWKFNQARKYFQTRGVELTWFQIDLPESRSEEVVKIAQEKARYAFKKLKKPLFVVDGALHIKCLNNFPKTYVKFVDKYLGARGLLKLLKGKRNRKWEFINLVYYKDKISEKSFPGILKGKVIKELKHNKRGYVRDFDRILLPDGFNETLAEMSKKEAREFDEKVWKPVVFDKFIRWLKKQN